MSDIPEEMRAKIRSTMFQPRKAIYTGDSFIPMPELAEVSSEEVKELFEMPTEISLTGELTAYGDEMARLVAEDQNYPQDFVLEFPRSWSRRLFSKPWRPHHTHERFAGLTLDTLRPVPGDGLIEMEATFGVSHRPTYDTYRRPSLLERLLARGWRRLRCRKHKKTDESS